MQPRPRPRHNSRGKMQLRGALNPPTEKHCCGVCFNDMGQQTAARLGCHPNCVKNNKLCTACSTTLITRAKQEGGRAKCPFCRTPYGRSYGKPNVPTDASSGVVELIFLDLPRSISTPSNATPVEALMVLENNNMMIMQHHANRLALQRQFAEIVMASTIHTNLQSQ